MIKKMTILKDELKPGDFPVEVGDNYLTIYREIPEFGTSAELNATQEELAKAKKALSLVNLVAHQYFAQARRLDGLGAHTLAHRSVVHGERIQAALRGEEIQDWDEPNLRSIHRDKLENAKYWSEWLSSVVDETLTDGTPLLTAVFEQHPELAARLRKVIEEKK